MCDNAGGVRQRPPRQPPGREVDDRLTQLEKLADLKERGVLSDAEFAEEKRRILGR
jgi:hypothetical protein